MSDSAGSRREPNVCGNCSAPFLQPDCWSRLDFNTWKLTVSCPNCLQETDLVLVEEEVRELYQSIETGLHEIRMALEELEREAFEGECRTLIQALRSNSVYPMDF
jgi:hypothetical protein